MAISKEASAVGVFNDLDTAERKIAELRRAGFSAEELGIIGHVGPDEAVPTPLDTHDPEENAITGLIRGALIGAFAGAFVILVIPGLGEVAGFGRWFDVLGGAVLSALICGLLVAFGSFVFMRPKTRLFATALQRGQFIVTVKNSARKEEAVSVLRRPAADANGDARKSS